MTDNPYEKTQDLLKDLELGVQTDTESPPCYPPGAELYPAAEETRVDFWRILLVDFVYQLSRAIMDERMLEEEKTHETVLAQFIDTLRRLDQMPDHEGVILLRQKEPFYQGSRTRKSDFNIFFGNILMDRRCLESIIQRSGPKVSYLELRLSKGFEILEHYQVRNLYIEIPRESPADLERMRTSLRIISAFHRALDSRAPVSFMKKGEKVPLSVIYDENDQPNPNLTVLSGLNDLEPGVLHRIVSKVDTWMRRPESKALGKQFTGIYSALFGIKKIQDKLTKPPIEINNVQWSLLERVHDVISTEKAQIAQFVIEKLGESAEKAAEIMESIYGDDFGKIDSAIFARRLLLASKLVDHMGEDWEYQSLREEVITNIRKRLTVVKDDIINDIMIKDDEIRAPGPGNTEIHGNANPVFRSMLISIQARSRTNLKVKGMVKHPVEFEDQDYQNISEKFDIPIEDAKIQVDLLKSCFDASGRFHREGFEKNIPVFARYERSIFEFLWYYLGEILSRKDRLDFLNAIQHLISKLKQPKKALLVLFDDFCRDPMEVRYSDRNALILCSLLIRTYNKEIHMDTEMTPEEVLQVWDGTNKPVIQTAAKWIEMEQKLFLKKMRTIHRFLLDTLDGSIAEADVKPLNYFLALEREIYIFLSIVGSETAFSVIRNALKEYGDPDSRIYRLKNSKNSLPGLLPLLQVCMRALSRGGESEDILLLSKISDRKERFIQFKKDDPLHADLVTRVMQWTGKAAKHIDQIRRRKQ